MSCKWNDHSLKISVLFRTFFSNLVQVELKFTLSLCCGTGTCTYTSSCITTKPPLFSTLSGFCQRYNNDMNFRTGDFRRPPISLTFTRCVRIFSLARSFYNNNIIRAYAVGICVRTFSPGRYQLLILFSTSSSASMYLFTVGWAAGVQCSLINNY